MKQIATLIDAPDELSRAGLSGALTGTRYKPVGVKGGWKAVAGSGEPMPGIVILVLSGMIKDVAALSKKIEGMAELSKVVVLADCCEANLVRHALCAGTSAFLPRSVAVDTLIQALNLAVDGKIIISSQIAREALHNQEVDAEPKRTDSPEPATAPERPGRLSLREIDIVKRLVHGESNKHISRLLDISETTVKVHVKSILRKIRRSNRTQAAIWGLDHFPAAPGTGPSAMSNALNQGVA